MSKYEVIIAGAGPAGAATASRLAQHGRAGRVLVLDRYCFPREKPCGGALTGHADLAMDELDFELDVSSWACASARVRFGTFERSVEMGKAVRVIRREEFDHSLVEQVRRRGVEVIEGEGVRSYRVDGEQVRVTTSRGRELVARVLVGADGAASVVRRALLGTKATPHRLFKHEMALAGGRAPDGDMLYDFSPMAAGLRGYLWVFPVPGDLVNVGLMHYPSERRGGRELSELLAHGLRDLGIELPERGTRGWPVWGYHPKTPISAPRVLLVGDAAGIDGLTGEGIAVAMEQAVLAGDFIDEGLESGDLGFGRYRKAVRRAIVGRELALDRWLARLLYGGKRWRDWLSLLLYDPDVLHMYAERVDGTEILADQKLRLYRALFRHLLAFRRRRRALRAAEPKLLRS